MKKNLFISTGIMAILATSCGTTPKLSYPETAREEVCDTFFGHIVSDPYRWLENDTSAATAEWVKQQNAVTNDYLSHIPFREALKERLTNISDYPLYNIPFKKNDKYYFFKREGKQNQSVLYVQDSIGAEPVIVLDPNILSEDGTVALSQISFSKDGKYLAYSIARSGSDWNEIYVLDLHSGKLLSDRLEWVKFSGISWQGNGFYYSGYDAPESGKEYSGKNEYHKVYFHEAGTPQRQDKLIFEDKKHPLRNVNAGTSDDEKYLFISQTESTSGNTLQIKDLTRHGSPWITISGGFDADYNVIDDVNGNIFILTNDNAPKWRLISVDPKAPEKKNWKEIIPESDNVLSSVRIAGDKLLVTYIKDAIDHAYSYNLDGTNPREIELPALGSIEGFSGTQKDNEAFYSFQSYTLPPTIYKYDVKNNKSEIFRSCDVNFNPEDYTSEQVFYTSKDGTKVPMTITYKKGIKLDGNNPALLYGYGGFDINLNPRFMVMKIPFLEQGGIYAEANLRGGGEYGAEWHKAGTKMQKQNVFDDFIAAAEYLVDKGYTSSKKLAINGGSNGGLLVGACLTQRPDLYAVAVPEVGVLDMLRYHRFTIGWAWATDYGKSDDSPEMFQYLLGYSPLHNVKEGTAYPATLVMTGDHDDRVVPAHSFKFAATLQAANNGTHPTLIRIDSKAGHGAGKPISKVIDAQADMFSFIMYNLGMKPDFK
ncbi:prolyl oligopeptidase family serine peptidase [Barnesiella propionica]|uniref:prolyl oligopeptidase family serine peptidase n=1 Tax=Barnesiella propionica TaxID=2981781 RepID=UPI0011CA3146|nr:prolyl oligopeptidase family serine peptidase [Barnesiella propionica]MCU6767965.1 prolyl oligopeptidase family serine peptidase [Barnesiella propionica]